MSFPPTMLNVSHYINGTQDPNERAARELEVVQ